MERAQVLYETISKYNPDQDCKTSTRTKRLLWEEKMKHLWRREIKLGTPVVSLISRRSIQM